MRRIFDRNIFHDQPIKRLSIAAAMLFVSACSSETLEARSTISSEAAYSDGRTVAFSSGGRDIVISENFAILADETGGRAYVKNYARRPAVVFIFDDGYQSHFDIVAPMFEKMHGRAGFAVVGDFLNRRGRLGKAELLSLQDRGFEILNHSRSHIPLREPGLTVEEVARETSGAKDRLQALGLDVNGYVTPYSVMHGSYLKHLETSHIYAFTMPPANNPQWKPNPPKHQLSRINTEKFADVAFAAIDAMVSERGLVFLYDHDIGKEKTSPAKLRSILAYAKNAGMELRTPTGAFRLRRLNRGTGCDYQSRSEGDYRFNCSIVFDLALTGTLAKARLSSIEDVNRNDVSITGDQFSLDIEGCEVNGQATRVDEGFYRGAVEGDCGRFHLLAAKAAGHIFILAESKDRIWTKRLSATEGA